MRIRNQEDKNINMRLKELGESLEDAMKKVMSEERRFQIEEFFGDLISYINGETQNLNAPEFIFEESVYGDKKSLENERKYLESLEELKAEMNKLKLSVNMTDNQKSLDVSVGNKSFFKAPTSIFIAILTRGLTRLFNFFKGILGITPNLNRKENKTDNRNRFIQAQDQIVDFIVDYSEKNLEVLHKDHINDNLDQLGKILNPAIGKDVDETQRKALDIFFSNCIDYVEGKTEALPIPEFIVDMIGGNLGGYAFQLCVDKIKKELDWFKNAFGENSDRVLEVRDRIIRSISNFVEEILDYIRGETEQRHGDEAVVPRYPDPFENMDVDYLVNQNKNQDKMAEQQHGDEAVVPRYPDPFENMDVNYLLDQDKIREAEKFWKGFFSGPYENSYQLHNERINRAIEQYYNAFMNENESHNERKDQLRGFLNKFVNYGLEEYQESKKIKSSLIDLSKNIIIKFVDKIESEPKSFEANMDVLDSFICEIASRFKSHENDKDENDIYNSLPEDLKNKLDILLGEDLKSALETNSEVSELDNNQNGLKPPEKPIPEENSVVDIENQIQNVVEEPKVDGVPEPPIPPGGWENFGAFLKDDSKNDKQNDNETISKPPEPPQIDDFYSVLTLSHEQQAIKNAVYEIRKMFSVEVGNKKIILGSKDLNGTSEYHKDKIKSLEKKINDLKAEKNSHGDKNFLSTLLSTAISNQRKKMNAKSTEGSTVGLIDSVNENMKNLNELLNEASKLKDGSDLYGALKTKFNYYKGILESINNDSLIKNGPTTEEFQKYDKDKYEENEDEDNTWDNDTNSSDDDSKTVAKVESFVNEFEKPGGLKDKISEINKMFSEHKEEIADIKSRINEAKQQTKVKEIENEIERLKFSIKKEERVLEIFEEAEKRGINIEYVKFPHKIGQQTKQQEKNNNDVELNQIEVENEFKPESSGKKSTDEKESVESRRSSLQNDLSKAIRARRENLHMHDDEDDEKEEDIDDFYDDVVVKPLDTNKVSEDKKSLSSVNENPKIPDENENIKKENENSDLKDETQKPSYGVNKNPGTLNKIKETMKENKGNGLDVIKEVDEVLEEDANEDNNKVENNNNYDQAPPVIGELDLNNENEVNNKVKDLEFIKEVDESLEEENENNKLEDKNSGIIAEKTDLDSPKLNKEAEKYISKTDKNTIKTTRLNSAAEEYLSNNGINLDIEEQIKINAIKNKYLELADKEKSHTEGIKSDTSNREVEKQNDVADKKTLGIKRSKTFDKKVDTGKNKEADKYSPLKRRNTISSEKMRGLVNIFENKDNVKKNRDNVQQSANLEKNKEKKSEERE